MKNIKIYWLLIAIMCTVTSCAEDEIELFNGVPAIDMAIMSEDGKIDTIRSVSFGFMEEDEIMVTFMACLQGVPTNYDRKIKIEISSDAVLGTDFFVDENVILHAGAHQVEIPCRIVRQPSMLNVTRKINITAVANDQFTEGVRVMAAASVSDGMPDHWVNDDMYAEYTLGKCTRVKYTFFYDMMGFYDLEGYGYGDFLAMQTYLNAKLAEYNADPDKFDRVYGDAPMVDENGDIVGFNYNM